MGRPLREREIIAPGLHAQTNLQLYAQLARGSYPEADIERVRDAYRLAMRLFSSNYRPSGNTLLAHVIGTASALVAIGARTDLVIAGLLHAAYPLGDFGTLRRTVDRHKRARLRAVVGADVEAIVFHYYGFAWNEASVAALIAHAAQLDAVERATALARLANEVDEFADLAPLHVGDYERRIATGRRMLPLYIRLADALGEPQLATRLAEDARECLTAERAYPPTLPVRATLLIAPASFGPRPRLRLRLLVAALRRLVRGLRAR